MYVLGMFLSALLLALTPQNAPISPSLVVANEKTNSGIALNAPWKITVYAFAQKNLKHQGWGIEHSERNYHVALALAKQEHLQVDEDVIFATAFLHDMDAFPAFSLDLPHGTGSAQESEPILRDAGFPMQKFAAVRDSMIAHMYTTKPADMPKLSEAIVMHDADTLEFIGAIGIARTIALIGDGKNLAGSRRSLEKNRALIPSTLITKAARRIANRRIQEMNAFLDALDRETLGRTAE